MSDSKPIACELAPPDLAQRKATLLKEVFALVQETRELDNGFAYQFHGDPKTLDKLFEMIRLERVCCPFFEFRLTVTDEGSPVWLEMTGGEGAKQFVMEELAFDKAS